MSPEAQEDWDRLGRQDRVRANDRLSNLLSMGAAACPSVKFVIEIPGTDSDDGTISMVLEVADPFFVLLSARKGTTW